MDYRDNACKERTQAHEIIEMFEELLEEKNITIHSDDRTGDISEARIYGCEYFDLEERITQYLKGKNNEG